MLADQDLLVLLPVAFFTSVISVVTGATSLITVPVMLALGMEAGPAIATNMLALLALSLGAAQRFLVSGTLPLGQLKTSTLLTVFGSLLGALLVSSLPPGVLKGVVVVAMLVMAVVVLRPPQPTVHLHGPLPGHTLTFLLGIYGGLFSGGYVTLLTVVFTHTLGFSLKGAIASTKWLNVFSSLVAVVVFGWQGLIDLKVGMWMALVMFVGAQLGAVWTARLPESTVRWVFTGAVVLLALRSLVMDLPWPWWDRG